MPAAAARLAVPRRRATPKASSSATDGFKGSAPPPHKAAPQRWRRQRPACRGVRCCGWAKETAALTRGAVGRHPQKVDLPAKLVLQVRVHVDVQLTWLPAHHRHEAQVELAHGGVAQQQQAAVVGGKEPHDLRAAGLAVHWRL